MTYHALISSIPNLDRLRDLVSLLEEVRDAGAPFDMGVYTRSEDCDSAACALGWAGRSRKFNARGFFLTEIGQKQWPTYACPEREEPLVGIPAACVFFGLSYTHASHLFKTDYPESPVQIESVIQRISAVIRAFEPREAAPAREFNLEYEMT